MTVHEFELFPWISNKFLVRISILWIWKNGFRCNKGVSSIENRKTNDGSMHIIESSLIMHTAALTKISHDCLTLSNWTVNYWKTTIEKYWKTTIKVTAIAQQVRNKWSNTLV